jgi:hypothetical protein
MILCEGDAPEGDPGQSCVHLFARILSTSFSSVSIFSVCCYYIVSISVGSTLLLCCACPAGTSRGGRKVRLIDLPIPIRSSDIIRRYNRLMSSSNFCIGRLCRFVLSSDSLIVRSCFLVLSSDFFIMRLCRPVLSKKSLYRYFIC